MVRANDYGNVADLYDTYVPADFDIPFFLAETKKTRGEVLELMSGTGRVSLPLIEAGVKLTCVDRSPEMLALLRSKLERKHLAADLHAVDVRELNLGRLFDLIFIPFHSFAEIISIEDERAALARIREYAKPDGRFICTLGNPSGPRRLPIDGRLRLFGNGPLPGGEGKLLSWIMQDYDAKDNHIVRVVEFFEEYDVRGVLKTKRLLELAFRLISKAEFEALAQSAGFQVVALYGNYDLAEFDETTSPFMIWDMRAN